jgi:hypothetical protein
MRRDNVESSMGDDPGGVGAVSVCNRPVGIAQFGRRAMEFLIRVRGSPLLSGVL